MWPGRVAQAPSRAFAPADGPGCGVPAPADRTGVAGHSASAASRIVARCRFYFRVSCGDCGVYSPQGQAIDLAIELNADAHITDDGFQRWIPDPKNIPSRPDIPFHSASYLVRGTKIN